MKHKEKTDWKKYDQGFNDLWDNIKQLDLHACIWSPIGEKRENMAGR